MRCLVIRLPITEGMEPKDEKRLDYAFRRRDAQDMVLWIIFGFWGAIQGQLVLGLAGHLADPAVGLLVSALGALSSFTWWGIQGRAIRNL